MKVRESLWAVYNKNSKTVMRLCETREVARTYKRNYGGLHHNITIIKYVPTVEVR